MTEVSTLGFGKREALVRKIGGFKLTLCYLIRHSHQMPGNRIRPSIRWFNTVENNAWVVLKADSMRDWQNRPVKTDALRSQKRLANVILQRAELGKWLLRHRQKSKAYGCQMEIIHLWAELNSEPDRIRGAKIQLGKQEGARAQNDQYIPNRRIWQRLAKEIRLKNPKLNDSAVTEKIFAQRADYEEPDSPKWNVHTIRKNIHRPQSKRNPVLL